MKTTRDIARVTGYGLRHAIYMCQTGEIASIKVTHGKRTRYEIQDHEFERWLTRPIKLPSQGRQINYSKRNPQ